MILTATGEFCSDGLGLGLDLDRLGPEADRCETYVAQVQAPRLGLPMSTVTAR